MKTTPLADRFWAKVKKTDECWLWTGCLQHGSGVISSGKRGGTNLRAAWVSIFLESGKWPDPGTYILHRCRVGACVRPDHLYAALPQDRHQPWTHNRFLKKLTGENAVEIRGLFATGNVAKAELARRFGVAPKTIRSVLSRVTWKHV